MWLNQEFYVGIKCWAVFNKNYLFTIVFKSAKEYLYGRNSCTEMEKLLVEKIFFFKIYLDLIESAGSFNFGFWRNS